jgi:hypothetical protein
MLLRAEASERVLQLLKQKSVLHHQGPGDMMWHIKLPVNVDVPCAESRNVRRIEPNVKVHFYLPYRKYRPPSSSYHALNSVETSLVDYVR